MMPVTMKPAFEWTDHWMPMPSRGGQGVTLVKKTLVAPIGVTAQPTAIQIMPAEYYCFADLHQDDLRGYKELVKQAIAMAEQERLARLNIAKPPLVGG